MVKITFFALIVLCVVCLILFGATTMTNGGQVYKTFATHPDVPPVGGTLVWAKTDGTMQTTNSSGTDAGMGGGGGGGAGPIVSASNSVAYLNADFPVNARAPVAFDTHEFDTSGGAMHSTSVTTSHFIAPTTGYYLAECSMMQSVGNNFYIYLRLNGTTDVQGGVAGAGVGVQYEVHRVNTILHMNANEYVECTVQSATGTNGTPAFGTSAEAAHFKFMKVF